MSDCRLEKLRALIEAGNASLRVGCNTDAYFLIPRGVWNQIVAEARGES